MVSARKYSLTGEKMEWRGLRALDFARGCYCVRVPKPRHALVS